MIYTIFIQQLLFGIIALLLTYVTGKLIVGFFKSEGNFFFRLFITYIIGITSIVLVYSIIKAQGRTVNMLLLPLIAYLIYYFRKSFTTSITFNMKEIIREFGWSLLPFLFVFLYQSWFYFDFGNKSIKSVFPDFYWYSTMSESLTLWGIESRITEMNFFFPEYRQGLLPYHYPELWVTSFFSSILKNSSLNAYYFTTLPIFILIYMLGIYSLFENFIKSKIILIPVGFILLFTSGFVLPFFIINAHNTWGIVDIIGQKLGFIYCFIILVFIFVTRQQKEVGLLILGIVPIFSITFIPCIWLGIVTFCVLIKLLSKKYLTNKEILLNIAFIVYFIIGYFIFYAINKSNYASDFAIKRILNTGIFKHTYGEYSISNIKIICSNFLIYTVPTVLIHIGVRLYLFSIFLLLFLRKVIKHWELFLLMLLILLYGAISTAISVELFDHDQFVEALSALFVVFVIILIADFYSSKVHKMAKWIVGLLLIFIYNQSISETLRNKKNASKNDITFLQNVNNSLSENTNVILMFNSEKDIKSCASFHFLSLTNELLSLSQISNKRNITVIANPEKYIQYKRLNYTDSFNYFQLSPINVWKSKGNDLHSFISFYHIKYFYFKEGVEIPSFISENAEKIIESKITKSKFIKIR